MGSHIETATAIFIKTGIDIAAIAEVASPEMAELFASSMADKAPEAEPTPMSVEDIASLGGLGLHAAYE